MKKEHALLPAVILALGVLVTASYFGIAHRKVSRESLARTAEATLPAADTAPTPAPSGPVVSQGAPARHVPDRELFASTWQSSPRDEFAAFANWTRGYLEVKKDMKGRYPKHRWPDEPWAEKPSLKTRNAFDASAGSA